MVINVIKAIPVQREGRISCPVHGDRHGVMSYSRGKKGTEEAKPEGPTPTCLEESSGI